MRSPRAVKVHLLQPYPQSLLRAITHLGLGHAREALGGLAVRALPVFLVDVFRERVEEDVDLREVQRQADGVHGRLERAPVAELRLDAHAADADPVPHARTPFPDSVLRVARCRARRAATRAVKPCHTPRIQSLTWRFQLTQ